VRSRLGAAIHGRIVGQEKVIEDLLIALFARGHCLFIGVPGLAKTLLVSTTAEALGLSFGRVQFTPDLMPADITGRRCSKRTARPDGARCGSSTGRSSRTSCSPTRSTARRRRRRRRSSRRCRSRR
jgi:MoxR-like ATPase